MDDEVSKRLTALEVGQAEIRTELRAQLPHLATKADVEAVRVEMLEMHSDVIDRLGKLETTLEARTGGIEVRLETRIGGVETRLEAKIASVETRLIKWMVATTLSGAAVSAAVASAISRFF